VQSIDRCHGIDQGGKSQVQDTSILLLASGWFEEDM